jgi:hypothetical protein
MRPLAVWLSYSLLAASGCIAVTNGKVRPGLMRDFSRSSRDPDPTLNPNAEPTENPWMPEGEAAHPEVGSRSELVQTAAAAVAAIAAGAMPMIVFSGTFDENRLFDVPHSQPAAAEEEGATRERR